MEYKKLFKYIFLLVLICTSFSVDASIINGTITLANHTAQVCENIGCTVSGTSPVNFGVFTSTPSSNVVVTDTALSGYIWGKSFGFAVLNCSNTTSGCSVINGNFKVANDYNGHLSGYAWGDTSGWINFGPFTNSATSPVTINSGGQFNGYAWSQNQGWIKFDCSDPSYCVETDWRPRNSRPQCSDGIDNDSDGAIDGSDSGCINNGVYDPTDNLEFVSTNPGGGPSVCLDHAALNYNGALPCRYPQPTLLCLDHSAINYGGPLPCQYQPPVLCLDHNATNYNGPAPCAYPSTLCNDSSASNFGGPLPCQYPVPCTVNCNPPCTINCTPPCTINCTSPCTVNCTPSSCTGIGCITPPPVKKTIDFVSGILDIPKVAVATQIITTAGALFGILLSFSTTLFANPLTFSEMFLIPIRLWSLLLSALGLKKRNRPWGIVYDSITKQPLDPAYVVLQDLQGNEVTTSITDLDGRYGFLVPAGQYRMIAHKTNYEFPSRKLAGKNSDELYADLYFNEIITVTEGGVITKNIPMDPLNFDWNEFAKRDQKLMKFYSKRDVFIANLSNVLFYLGFALTTVAVIVTPKLYNSITFGVYVALFVLKHTVLKPRPFGRLITKGTGAPLSFAVIKVYVAGLDHEITKKVADMTGKYYCLIPNGNYYVKIEVKNKDATYTLVHTSEPFEVKNGYINKKFEV